jgi:glycogen debranching enzyme
MIILSRETTGDRAAALDREWLVTNGLGGYAAGTVSMANTRRYHGLLLAAIQPPVARALLLAKLDGEVDYADRRYALATNEFADGTIDPLGYRLLERFWLDGGIPTWRYALADALLEQRIWMSHGQNTTYITYTLARAAAPLQLRLRALVSERDHHANLHIGDDRQIWAEPIDGGLRIHAGDGAIPWYMLSDGGTFEQAHGWVRGVRLRVETERGLDDLDDVLHIATWSATLEPGATLTLVATTEEDAPTDGVAAYEAEAARQCDLLTASRLTLAPPAVRQLVLAADQFIVDRADDRSFVSAVPEEPRGRGLVAGPRSRPTTDEARLTNGKTVIAGYPWFTDWGRDTMISLPGLTLATGRPEVAASILRTFARYLDMGMLPNRFPEAGEQPEYNTVDATLWYLHAIYAYTEATDDPSTGSGQALELARELWPALTEIIAWHERGTRYRIGVDPADGLLRAGEPGVQLTWMDVKIGDWVVTPRHGKPVEINALWINGLRALARLGARLGQSDAARYDALADRAEASFIERFPYHDGGYLYDVVDAPEGDDRSLRPNQLFAISLPFGPLAQPARRDLARSVVETCGRELLTSHGLRSLAPSDPAYIGRYGGDQRQRDSAYHQGTVWGWLIGTFVEAHLRVYDDPARARGYLEPLLDHLSGGALGTQSEIFEGDPPFAPRGCFAQAWTIAETLRAWRLCTKS